MCKRYTSAKFAMQGQHVSIIKGLFVHLLTLLIVEAFLSYGINIMGNNRPEKNLRTKLNIWPNTGGIEAPYS